MNHMQREKYSRMSLKTLRKFRQGLDEIIMELEAGPRREIDIADEHSGDPTMIHEILEVKGDKQSGTWQQLERIYCSPQRCPKCPHGPSWYKYRLLKGSKKLRVTFLGVLFFDYEALQQMKQHIRPPIFKGTIQEAEEWLKQQKTEAPENES